MSRIDDLIEELCPFGVRFSELDDYVVTNRGGGTPSRSNPGYWNGDIPWASVGDLTIPGIEIVETRNAITQLGLNDSSTNIVPEGDVIVAVKISPGKMKIAGCDMAINQDLRGLTLSEELDARFLTYYFQTLNLVGNGTIVKGITNARLMRTRIPVPPVEVQREIVRILDTFSALEAELEAELEARRRQYAHYRDHLFNIHRHIQATRLKDAAVFRRGTAITEKQAVPGNVPVVANGPLSTYSHNQSNRRGETVVVARSGAYAGLVSYWSGPIFLTDAFSVHPDETRLTPKYVYYFLQSKQSQLHSMKKGAGVPHVRVKEMEMYEIPIPPVAEQKRIVGILDKFDALVNDLSVGLPAELAARRTQYEHYRDRLLTFEERV